MLTVHSSTNSADEVLQDEVSPFQIVENKETFILYALHKVHFMGEAGTC